MNIQPITEQLITRQQMKQFIFSLADITRDIFSTKKPFEKHIKDTLPLYLSECLLECLYKNNADLKSPRQTKHALEEISELLEKLPVVRLTIAWEPTVSQLQQIFEATRRLLPDGKTSGVKEVPTPEVEEEGHILLDILINPSIFAGAIIEYKGKYGDYSLGSKITHNF